MLRLGLNSQAYGQRGLDKSVLEGSASDPGIIPRALNELFALRRRLGLAMSCCMFEVHGEAIRDLIDPAALAAADIRDDCVRLSKLERMDVREVLIHQRQHTFTLLSHAMKQRRARLAAASPGDRGHFVTVVRVERPNQAKRGLLYLVDLSGMSDMGDADVGMERSQLKDAIGTNSDLVRNTLVLKALRVHRVCNPV